MEVLLILIVLVCGTSAVSIMPELKHNVLRFGYGVNFRYEGMLSHSFDQFYVVMKIEIPGVSDLNLTLFQFDYNCSHVVNIEKGTNFKVPSLIKDMFNVYCKNIIPYMYLYKHQVEYYDKAVYDILEKDIGLILPRFEDREFGVYGMFGYYGCVGGIVAIVRVKRRHSHMGQYLPKEVACAPHVIVGERVWPM